MRLGQNIEDTASKIETLQFIIDFALGYLSILKQAEMQLFEEESLNKVTVKQKYMKINN